MIELKNTRKKLNITQQDVSDILGIPLRTIESWESNNRKTSTWIQKLIIDKLNAYEYGPKGIITERKGIYSFEQIQEKIRLLSFKFDINKVILFGSYAAGKAQVTSDIDIVVDTNITGMKFFSILEEAKKLFIKRVDIIRLIDIKKDTDFYKEIMSKGVVIYEQ